MSLIAEPAHGINLIQAYDSLKMHRHFADDHCTIYSIEELGDGMDITSWYAKVKYSIRPLECICLCLPRKYAKGYKREQRAFIFAYET